MVLCKGAWSSAHWTPPAQGLSGMTYCLLLARTALAWGDSPPSSSSRHCAVSVYFRRVSRWVGTLAVLAACTALAGCQSGDRPSSSSNSDPPPTSSPANPSSTTQEPRQEPRRQRAVRLAKGQLKAFYRIQNDLLQHPEEPLDVLDLYLRDQVLVERQQYTEGFRDRGERQVGSSSLIKFRVGDVAFRDTSPHAAVELEVCYDLGDSHFVDSSGQLVPARPGAIKVGYARFALFADKWPSDSIEDWRIGRQEVEGKPCSL
jgi:hypothetical protein